MERTVKNIAEASGATGELTIDSKTLVTYNDPQLTQQMIPSLLKATNGNATIIDAQTGAEDFSFFGAKVPSLFFYVGGMPEGKDPKQTAAHHTPDFYIDERGMKTGIKAFCYLVLDYMNAAQKKDIKKRTL
jgi:amidohydrolase